jgi:hypothetical protein
MALSLVEEQKLEKVGLVAFFHHGQAAWIEDARKAYAYLRAQYPQNVNPRRDDVARVLAPVIEVSPPLQDELARRRLTQKFWFSYFTNLIIDRSWHIISAENQP